MLFLLPLSICSETSTLSVALFTRWPHLITVHITSQLMKNTIYNLDGSFPLGLFLGGSLSSQSVFPFWVVILTKFAACCEVQHSHLMKKITFCVKYSWSYWLLKDVTFAKLSTRLSSAASNRNRASCQKCQHHTAVDVYCTLTKIFLFLVLALSSIEMTKIPLTKRKYTIYLSPEILRLNRHFVGFKCRERRQAVKRSYAAQSDERQNWNILKRRKSQEWQWKFKEFMKSENSF